jgi:hypothetical protein
MGDEATIPDLKGCQVYCHDCETYRPVRRAKERDAVTGEGYYEFVCVSYASILVSIHRGKETPLIV